MSSIPFVLEKCPMTDMVEHKIGFGGFSTVWMAYDLQDKIIQDVQDSSHLVTYLTTFLLPRPGDKILLSMFEYPSNVQRKYPPSVI